MPQPDWTGIRAGARHHGGVQGDAARTAAQTALVDQWQRDAEWRARRHDRPAAKRFRLIFPFVVAMVIQVPFAIGSLSRAQNQLDGLIALGIAVVGPIALLGSRRWPGPVVAFVAAITVVQFALFPNSLLGDNFTPPPVALLFALLLGVVRNARVWSFVSVGALWVSILLVGLVAEVNWRPIRVVGVTLGLLIVLGIAEAIRSRRDRYSAFRKEASERRVSAEQAERVRMARELHDVLAHSLSSINVQASVALHLLDAQPERAAQSLTAIRDASKLALDEVRSVIGILRSDAGDSAPLRPEPDLSRISELVETAAIGGIQVTFSNELDAKLAPSASVQLAVYRIVQEALTNMVRHSGATAASVSLRGDGPWLLVDIADNGPGKPHPSAPGSGIIGMRERAALLGGTLDASAQPTGGFRVSARFPIGSAS